MLARRLTSVLLAGLLVLLGFLPHLAGAGTLGPVPANVKVDEAPRADVPFDLSRYKANWRQRIEAMRQSGLLPVIDVESSFNPGGFAPRNFAEQMDKRGVALVAFSPQVGEGGFKRDGRVWTDAARGILSVDLWRFLAALDLGGDRMDRLGEHMDVLRRFLDGLPPGAREITAYRAAWRLLFNEDF